MSDADATVEVVATALEISEETTIRPKWLMRGDETSDLFLTKTVITQLVV